MHVKLLRFLAAAPPFLQDRPPVSEWDFWPFSAGVEESWLFLVTKGLFILAIFAVIVVAVRCLFGPGGMLAEPWMREEWEARRQADLAELEARKARGELAEAEYQRRRRKLERPV